MQNFGHLHCIFHFAFSDSPAPSPLLMPQVRPNIAEMKGYVPGEQPGGAKAEKFIKLNTNENPYPCSTKVKAAIGRVVQAGLQKYPDPLATAFRIRAGELLGVDPDWILCGNGSDDILTIVTRTFVGTSRRLRELVPGIICAAVQPDSPLHDLEGLKHLPTAIVPGIWDPSLADTMLSIST